MKPEPIKVTAKDAQAMLLAHLRACNYIPQRTSELSKALNIQPSCIRRAGLALASRNVLQADLIKGRGKGEYLFTLQQLDLFYDQPTPGFSWTLASLREALAEAKAKLLMLTFRRKGGAR